MSPLHRSLQILTVRLTRCRRSLPSASAITRRHRSPEPAPSPPPTICTRWRAFSQTAARADPDTEAAAPQITPAELRSVMRKVPSQVVVVTLNTPSTPTTHLGTTCSSFTSVSLTPPIISFCVRTPSRTSHVLTTHPTGDFAVHILSKHQTAASLAFSSPRTQHDLSAFPHHIDACTSLPILHNCLGVLICRVCKDKRVQVGDHEVWFGEVVRIVPGVGSVSGETSMEPLVYYESSYRSVGDEVFMERLEKGGLSFREWTHRAHLRMAWIYLRESTKKEDAFPKIKKAIQTHNAANAHLIKHGYNETITWFYLHLIDLALKDHHLHSSASASSSSSSPPPTPPDASRSAPNSTTRITPAVNQNEDFLDFIARYPVLEDRRVVGRYYSADVLRSEGARERVVEPDRRRMPRTIQEAAAAAAAAA